MITTGFFNISPLKLCITDNLSNSILEPYCPLALPLPPIPRLLKLAHRFCLLKHYDNLVNLVTDIQSAKLKPASTSLYCSLGIDAIIYKEAKQYTGTLLTLWPDIYRLFGERVRFLFTSCVKQTNQRSDWVCFTQRVNKNRTSDWTVKWLIYYIHTEIHKRTELKDKHILNFFQRKTTRGQATSQFESCTEMASLWNTLHLNYQSKMLLKGRTS